MSEEEQERGRRVGDERWDILQAWGSRREATSVRKERGVRADELLQARSSTEVGVCRKLS